MIFIRGLRDNGAWNKPATRIRVGTNLLFFNPGEDDMKIPSYLDNDFRLHLSVHVFVTSTKCATETLRDFINEWHRQLTEPRKLIIHIPRQVKDLYVLIKHDFEEHHMWDHPKSPKMWCETNGPVFELPGDFYHSLNILYDKDGVRPCLEYRRVCNRDPFAAYDCARKVSAKPGPFDTLPKVLAPELFKDQLLDRFKRLAPEGILSSFKDDDDIWDYMLNNGEWSVEDDEPVTDENT